MPNASPLMLRAAVHALLAATVFASPARADLLVNGSFESGPPIPGGQLVLSSGSTALPGWSVATGSVKAVQAYWQPAHLDRSLGLNGTAAGAISQSFPTVSGEQYDVSFMMSGEPLTVPGLKHLRVSAAGQSSDFSFDSEHNWEWDMFWTQKLWSFTANGATAVLEFRSLSPGFDGPAVDQVLVTGPTVGVGERSVDLRLGLPRPNPARGRVTIECSLPHAGRASVAVIDLQGRVVASLADGELAAGAHTFVWTGGTGERGAGPGLYFVRLTVGGNHVLRRLALLR